jgi:hypothetical protein
MYSSEYTSGFSGPVASHLVAPLSPRHEGNVGQAPRSISNMAQGSRQPTRADETVPLGGDTLRVCSVRGVLEPVPDLECWDDLATESFIVREGGRPADREERAGGTQ